MHHYFNVTNFFFPFGIELSNVKTMQVLYISNIELLAYFCLYDSLTSPEKKT